MTTTNMANKIDIEENKIDLEKINKYNQYNMANKMELKKIDFEKSSTNNEKINMASEKQFKTF